MERSEHKTVCELKCQAEAHIAWTYGSVMFCSAECKSLSNKNWKCKDETKYQGHFEYEIKTFWQSSCQDRLGMLQNKHTDRSSGGSRDTYGPLNIFILKTQLRRS